MNCREFYVITEESPIDSACDDSFKKALIVYLNTKEFIVELNSPITFYAEQDITCKYTLEEDKNYHSYIQIDMQIEQKNFTFFCMVVHLTSEFGFDGDLAISESGFGDTNRFCIELTKNTDSESGNQDEQRLSKFGLDAVLFNSRETKSKNKSDSYTRHDKTRKVYHTLGTMIFHSVIGKRNIIKEFPSTYASLEQAEEWLFKRNAKVVFDVNTNVIRCEVNLRKGNGTQHNDPNVGFVIGAMRLIRYFTEGALVVSFVKHNMQESFFAGNNKLVKALNLLNIKRIIDNA